MANGGSLEEVRRLARPEANTKDVGREHSLSPTGDLGARSGPSKECHSGLEQGREASISRSLSPAAATRGTGDDWEAANKARQRLRDNPVHGLVTPSDLGGPAAVAWSDADRWMKVVGDEGSGDASHIPPGAYFTPEQDPFDPRNLPNLFMSTTRRFGPVVGDQGNGEASHLHPGMYEWEPHRAPTPATCAMRSTMKRFGFLVGEPDTKEQNLEVGPGYYKLQQFSPFGDFNNPPGKDVDYPGKGPTCTLAKRDRFRPSYAEAVRMDEIANAPFSHSAEIEAKRAWEAAPQSWPQASRFTPREERPKSVDPKHFTSSKSMHCWSGVKESQKTKRSPLNLRQLGLKPFYTGPKRDPALTEKVQTYLKGNAPLPKTLVHGGRPLPKKRKPVLSPKNGGPPFTEVGDAAHLSSVAHQAATGGNLQAHHMNSIVEREPHTCFWLGQSETTKKGADFEPGKYTSGLIDHLESIKTWGIHTAKERWKLGAKITGVSLDQALNGDKPEAAKKKDAKRWRPSDQTPTSEYVMAGRVGGTGMPRNLEVQTLRMIDKKLSTPARAKSSMK